MNYDTIGPGRELDALIAEKVMGWEVIDYTSHEDVHKAKGPIVYARGASFPVYRNSCSYPERWTPSQDIGAAWDVLMEIQRRTRFVVVKKDDRERLSMGWVVLWDPYERGVECSEGDLPVVICRAALKAVSQ